MRAERRRPDVYIQTSREGLKWSDGKPLTAQDFVWSRKELSADTAADYEYMFESIEGYAE